MTLSEECTCRMWMTGLCGSYVPGTASSKSRHISSLGDTYWSSREVNWNANLATQQILKWIIKALTERSKWAVEPVILKMKYLSFLDICTETYHCRLYYSEKALSGWIDLINSRQVKTVLGPVSRNFRARKLPCMFVVFALKTKVSIIILKMVQSNYQLTKPNGPVCEPGTVVLFNRFWFQNLSFAPKKLSGLSWNGPWSASSDRRLPP